MLKILYESLEGAEGETPPVSQMKEGGVKESYWETTGLEK